MSRYTTEACTLNGEVFTIPAPAIDMSVGQVFSGGSGQFINGGSYVRRSPFGSRTLSVSWNALTASDLGPLDELLYAGPFYWNNPFDYGNIAPVWLNPSRGIRPGDVFPREYSLSSGGAPQVVVHDGEPALDYTGLAVDREYTFYVPTAMQARIRATGEDVGLLTPTLITAPGLHDLSFSGIGYLHTVSITLEPLGTTQSGRITRPAGMSALDFSHEGLSLVQHSAALDIQSATATWIETGWWSNL